MPTFGDTNEYGAAVAPNNNMFAIKGSPDSNGTANSIFAYIRIDDSGDFKCALYDENLDFIASTEEKSLSYSAESVWVEFEFSEPKPSLTSGSDYYIITWCNTSDTKMRYTTDAWGEYIYTEIETYGTWPESIPYGWDSTYEDFSLSTYCTYTESTGEGTLPRTGFHINKGGSGRNLVFINKNK